MDLLGRYGIGQASDLSVDQVRERLAATLALLRQRLPADEAEPIIAEMRPLWLR